MQQIIVFFYKCSINLDFIHSFTIQCIYVTTDSVLNSIANEFEHFFAQPNAYRSVLILIISLGFAVWLSRFLAQIIVKIAQSVATRSDNESDDERALRLRQIETYLSVAVAVVRAAVVAVVGYIAWRILSPFDTSGANSGAAAIGAGAFFVVFAGQTLGIVLRDLTSGSIMIAERWFNVGDFIKIEPFWDVSGVVERFTLRSTRLRALNGEIIWVHNQHITGVHVTPRGVRTLAVDVFVRDRDVGIEKIKRIINAIPKGKTMLARPLKINVTEKWGDDIWRITVVGQTPPGREWLIQDYFVEAVKSIDKDKNKSERLLAHAPIARFADSEADRRFKRAVRVKQEKDKPTLV